MNIVFFPGSFDPFTKGHADIAERMSRLCSKVIIGVGYNTEKPESAATARQRAEKIKSLYSAGPLASKIEAVVYSGLTMEEARRLGADCVVRGVRNATDFDYEYSLAAANRKAFGIETVLLPADPQFGFVSSSIVRDLQRYGASEEASGFLPKHLK